MQGQQVLRRQTRLSFTACNLPLHQKADETCPFLEWVKSCSKVSTRSQFILHVPILNRFLNHKKHRVVVHHCSSKKKLYAMGLFYYYLTICYIHFWSLQKNSSQWSWLFGNVSTKSQDQACPRALTLQLLPSQRLPGTVQNGETCKLHPNKVVM